MRWFDSTRGMTFNRVLNIYLALNQVTDPE